MLGFVEVVINFGVDVGGKGCIKVVGFFYLWQFDMQIADVCQYLYLDIGVCWVVSDVQGVNISKMFVYLVEVGYMVEYYFFIDGL